MKGSQVVIYSLDKNESTESFALCKLTEWTHNYLVRSLASHDDKLFVADAINSVSVLKFENSELSLVAKDYRPLWPVCIQAWDSTSIIGSNVSLADVSLGHCLLLIPAV